MSIHPLNNLHHCQYSINFHLVLVTKYRKRCITKPILEELENIFKRLCERWGCELFEFNGEPDHVHMLLGLTPRIQPSIFVNNLKTVSSRLIRRDFKEHLAKHYFKRVFWSRIYCLISCGGAPLSVLKAYIENQSGAD